MQDDKALTSNLFGSFKMLTLHSASRPRWPKSQDLNYHFKWNYLSFIGHWGTRQLSELQPGMNTCCAIGCTTPPLMRPWSVHGVNQSAWDHSAKESIFLSATHPRAPQDRCSLEFTVFVCRRSWHIWERPWCLASEPLVRIYITKLRHEDVVDAWIVMTLSMDAR